MTKKPLVSIIMPVYNEEKYLKSCLQSIINQQFEQWELIAVDDFSTDRSANILGQFCTKDHRIRVVKNESKGIIPALRKAFSLTRGPMITRMDADDIMPVEKLAMMVGNLAKLGAGNVVSGQVKYFAEEELQDGFRKYEHWINRQLYYQNIYQECTLPSACWMAYKEDLVRINAFVDSIYPEDYDLLFTFYLHQLEIHGIKHVLHHWRDHPERASRNDPNYQDQNFFHLKLKYFMEIDRDFDKALILWGAGKKGKALAKEMMKYGQDFTWITSNPKKMGREIYGISLQSISSIQNVSGKQVLVAISALSFQQEKVDLYEDLGLSTADIFEFCK